jgi:hypothetical protein
MAAPRKLFKTKHESKTCQIWLKYFYEVNPMTLVLSSDDRGLADCFRHHVEGLQSFTKAQVYHVPPLGKQEDYLADLFGLCQPVRPDLFRLVRNHPVLSSEDDRDVLIPILMREIARLFWQVSRAVERTSLSALVFDPALADVYEVSLRLTPPYNADVATLECEFLASLPVALLNCNNVQLLEFDAALASALLRVYCDSPAVLIPPRRDFLSHFLKIATESVGHLRIPQVADTIVEILDQIARCPAEFLGKTQPEKRTAFYLQLVAIFRFPSAQSNAVYLQTIRSAMRNFILFCDTSQDLRHNLLLIELVLPPFVWCLQTFPCKIPERDVVAVDPDVCPPVSYSFLLGEPLELVSSDCKLPETRFEDVASSEFLDVFQLLLNLFKEGCYDMVEVLWMVPKWIEDNLHMRANGQRVALDERWLFLLVSVLADRMQSPSPIELFDCTFLFRTSLFEDSDQSAFVRQFSFWLMKRLFQVPAFSTTIVKQCFLTFHHLDQTPLIVSHELLNLLAVLHRIDSRKFTTVADLNDLVPGFIYYGWRISSHNVGQEIQAQFLLFLREILQFPGEVQTLSADP